MTVQIHPQQDSQDNHFNNDKNDQHRSITSIGQKLSPLSSNALPQQRHQQEFVRYNGWNRPLHLFQIIGWTIFLLFGFINFLLLIPNMSSLDNLLPLFMLNLFIYLSHFLTHIVASTINPIDSNVMAKHRNCLKPKKFDRSKHEHVIENQFCYICESTVGSKSKHCSLCNKCIEQFDHHCKWLNNCIGRKNYRWFVLSMITALMQALIILVTSTLLIISLYSNDMIKSSKLIIVHYEVENNGSIKILWSIILYITFAIASISTLLLLHLCIFHIFLNIIGESTYEFVMRQRSLLRQAKQPKISDQLTTNNANQQINDDNDRHRNRSINNCCQLLINKFSFCCFKCCANNHNQNNQRHRTNRIIDNPEDPVKSNGYDNQLKV